MRLRTTKVLLFGLVFLVTGGFATCAVATTLGPITVANPSFEDTTGVIFNGSPCGPGCAYSFGQPIPGWTSSSGGGTKGQFQPGTQFSFVPNGIFTAYSNGGTISQTVANVTVQDGITYILKVALGHRFDLPFFASADLLVGSNMFKAIGVAPAAGDWSTYTATFTGSAADAGDTITIQLNSTGVQGNFDDVSLTAVPEPSYLGVVGIGLAGLLAFALRNRIA